MDFCRQKERGFRLLTALDMLRHSQLLCDVEVRFGTQTLHAHLAVLAASSDYFVTKLKSGSDEKTDLPYYLEIVGLNEESVHKCLEYLYTGKIFIDFESLNAILEACSTMQLEEMKEICFDFMKANLSVDKCLDILEYAATYNSQTTTDATFSFISDNFQGFIGTARYCNVERDMALEFIRGSKKVATRVIWRGISNWINHDLASRKDDLMLFLNEIPQFDPKSTLHDILSDPLVFGNEDITRFLVETVFLDKDEDLEQHLDDSNWFLAYESFAVCSADHRCNPFSRAIQRYVFKNFMVLSKQQQFLSIGEEDFFVILKANETKNYCETIRWQAVVDWIAVDKSREIHFEKLASLINFKNLSPKFIQEQILTHPFMKSAPALKETIFNDIFFHTQKSTKLNSCLLFDSYSGDLHSHVHGSGSWTHLSTSKDIANGKLLGGNGEAYVLKFSNLYKIRKDGAIEIKTPFKSHGGLKAYVLHSGSIFVFHNRKVYSKFDLSICKWETGSNGFGIPVGSSCCSTSRGILFLGGVGNDQHFTRLYDPDYLSIGSGYIKPMPNGRSYTSCAAVANNVFVIGRTGNLPYGGQLDIQIYSFESNTWSMLDTSVYRLAKDLICCCPGESVCFVAGQDGENWSERELRIHSLSAWGVSALQQIPKVSNAQITCWAWDKPAISEALTQ